MAAQHPEVVKKIETIMKKEHEPHPYWMFPDEVPEGEMSPWEKAELPKKLKIQEKKAREKGTGKKKKKGK